MAPDKDGQERTIYTVPDALIFRNTAVHSTGQSRILLLKNTTGAELQGFVSLPWTPCFRLQQGSDGVLMEDPACLAVKVPPDVAVKVVIQLDLTAEAQGSTAAGTGAGTKNWHGGRVGRPLAVPDLLTVQIGPRTLLVPLRAVHQALDVPAGAGLDATLSSLTFHPPPAQLRDRALGFLSQLGQRLGIELPPPPQLLPQGQGQQAQSSDSNIAVAVSQGPTNAAAAQAPSAAPPASALQGQTSGSSNPTAPPATQKPSTQLKAPAAQPASQARTPAPAQELPPDTFSQPQDVSDDEDTILQHAPVILARTVVVEGRTARVVEVAPAPSGVTSAPPAPVAAVTRSRPASGIATTSGTSAPPPVLRPSSGGGSSSSSPRLRPHQPQHQHQTSRAGDAVSSPTGDSNPPVAFRIGDRICNARGQELCAVGDEAAEQMVRFSYTVIDVTATPQPPRQAPAGPGPGVARLGSAGRQLQPATALAPFQATLDPRSALGTGRPRSGQLQGLGGGRGMSDGDAGTLQSAVDAARAAALVAAVRELGLTDLPPPPMPAAAPGSTTPGRSSTANVGAAPLAAMRSSSLSRIPGSPADTAATGVAALHRTPSGKRLAPLQAPASSVLASQQTQRRAGAALGNPGGSKGSATGAGATRRVPSLTNANSLDDQASFVAGLAPPSPPHRLSTQGGSTHLPTRTLDSTRPQSGNLHPAGVTAGPLMATTAASSTQQSFNKGAGSGDNDDNDSDLQTALEAWLQHSITTSLASGTGSTPMSTSKSKPPPPMRLPSSTRRTGSLNGSGNQTASMSATRNAGSTNSSGSSAMQPATQPQHTAPRPSVSSKVPTQSSRPGEGSDSEGEGDERAGSRGIFGYEEPQQGAHLVGEEDHEPQGLAAASGLNSVNGAAVTTGTATSKGSVTSSTGGRGRKEGPGNTGRPQNDIDDISDQHARGIQGQLERMAAAGEAGVTTAAKGTKKGMSSSTTPPGPQILVFTDRKAPTAGPLKSSAAAVAPMSSTATFTTGAAGRQKQAPVFAASKGAAGATKGKSGGPATASAPVREPTKEELARMQAAWDAL